MDILSKLTPAETHLILETSNANLKDLMKYTFMDLLLKKVISTKLIKKQSHKNEPIRIHEYVVIGRNFKKYTPLAHEMIFLSPYFKNKSIKILFRHLVTMGFQNSGGEKRFLRKHLMSSPNLQKYIDNNLIRSLFGYVKLNKRGYEAQKKILRTIAKLEKELPDIILSDKKKVVEILLTIKGNVFLLKKLDFKLLKQIDKQLIEEFERQNRDYDSGCSGCGCWHSYDSYGDSFDSGYDSANPSYGVDSSGCSSCNSCSGCSGCGGCGGCS